MRSRGFRVFNDFGEKLISYRYNCMKTFSIELDNNGVAVIKLDIPCSDNNRINMEFLDELSQFLNRVDNQFDLSDSIDEIKTVFILSKMDCIFCSGYELN